MLCGVILMALFSCATGGKEIETTAENETTAKNEIFALTIQNLSEYRIVVSERLSKELSGATTSLREYLKQITGTDPEIKSDFVVENSDIYYETEYEILLGKTEREGIEELYQKIRPKDIGYVMMGKKIVMIGETGNIAEASVSLFKSDILDKVTDKENTPLLYAGESKIQAGNYSFSELKINGVDIYNYSIVYPFRSSLGESKIAEKLSTWIKQNTGYTVKYVSDNQPVTEYEIQIGDTNRITPEQKADMENKVVSDKHYYVLGSGETLWASGKTFNTVSRAVQEMLYQIDPDGRLNMNSAICKELKETSLSVMSYNVKSTMESSKRESEGVITSIKSRMPDIFTPQETTLENAKWIGRFRDALGDEYDVVLGLAVGKFTAYQPIYFKKDRFELVSSLSKYLTHTPDKQSKLEGQSEYYRIVTFAVLREKATGIEFVVSNNHFDIAGYVVRTEEAKILAKFLSENYPFDPLIVCGDFNTGVDTSPIQTLLSQTKLKPAQNIADEQVLTAGSGVSEDYTTTGNTIIDYIFVSHQNKRFQQIKESEKLTDGKNDPCSDFATSEITCRKKYMNGSRMTP